VSRQGGSTHQNGCPRNGAVTQKSLFTNELLRPHAKRKFSAKRTYHRQYGEPWGSSATASERDCICFRPAATACTAAIATISQCACRVPGGACTSQRWCWERWKPMGNTKASCLRTYATARQSQKACWQKTAVLRRHNAQHKDRVQRGNGVAWQTIDSKAPKSLFAPVISGNKPETGEARPETCHRRPQSISGLPSSA
jgi:hypothetical protein